MNCIYKIVFQRLIDRYLAKEKCVQNEVENNVEMLFHFLKVAQMFSVDAQCVKCLVILDSRYQSPVTND